MKKLFVVLLIATGIASFQLFNSCRHEIPIEHCLVDPIHIKLTKKDAVGDKANGSILATATGGSQFSFSLNGSSFQDTGFFAGLKGTGEYQVVAKNEWGCTDTSIIAVNSIDPCQGVTVKVTATKTDASPGKSDGSIKATATGGTGFTYSINGTNFQATGTFSGLAAGNYTVTAKNSNGCTGTGQVTIGTLDPCAGVTVKVTTTQVNPTNSQSNGSITASATGGTGFTFSLNNGTFQSSGTFTGLATGNYTITAKNSNGCTGTAQVALGSTNPCAGVTVTVTLTKTDPATGQSNGAITASASGGSGFTYSLNNGAFQSSGSFTGLAAGSYTITAKNSNGCLGSSQVTLVSANPCTNINITIAATAVDVVPCSSPANNGQITVTAGGSNGYSYNINGAAYQSSNVFNSLAAGTYTVGVRDANGCTNTKSVTVATAASGPLFAKVRTLITTRCSGSGCHMNGGSAAGYNFDNDCNIVSKWSQINGACVTGTLKRMPLSPQPALTAAEKQQITDWVNAGHTYSK